MNFWDHHGFAFILFMFFFPRLTMLLATTAGGDLFYWLGWLFLPRVTVAILATVHYLDQNPILVIFSWLWALGGESTEKRVVQRRVSSSPVEKDAEVHSVT